MSDETADNLPSRDALPEPVKRILDTLTGQETVLILCNHELYGGDWALLRADLVDRLAGRPFVVKVGDRIREDLERVQRLEAIEKEYGITLSDYVKI